MLDLRKPHEWYPVARALERRLTYHLGPTNSGKTYNALQAMCGCGHILASCTYACPLPCQSLPQGRHKDDSTGPFAHAKCAAKECML